jgi:excisionase family DNA binding protein
MALMLHWLKSIPQAQNQTAVDEVVLFLCFWGEAEVSIRNFKVSRNPKVAGCRNLNALAIDKTLGDIDRKYWTRYANACNLQACKSAKNWRGEARMPTIDPSIRKTPARTVIAPEDRLLIGRSEAAQMLSISERALDYLVANKQLSARRIGSRVLIPTSDLKRYSRADHPERLAG